MLIEFFLLRELREFIPAHVETDGELHYRSIHERWRSTPVHGSYLVDSASSRMLGPRTKPCKSKYESLYDETADGCLQQLWFL